MVMDYISNIVKSFWPLLAIAGVIAVLYFLMHVAKILRGEITEESTTINDKPVNIIKNNLRFLIGIYGSMKDYKTIFEDLTTASRDVARLKKDVAKHIEVFRDMWYGIKESIDRTLGSDDLAQQAGAIARRIETIDQQINILLGTAETMRAA